MRNLHTREAENNSSWKEQSGTTAHEKNKAAKAGNKKKYSLLVRGFHIFKPVPLIWYRNKKEKKLWNELCIYIILYYIILYYIINQQL
jgi:hypothetical protein